MPITYTTSNKVLGSGKIFFDLIDPAGALTGERYLGDTPGFTASIATEKVEDYTSDGATAQKDVNVTTKVTRTAKITCKNVDADNLALFVLGAVSSVAQSAASVTGEAVNNAQLGRFYQLGATATDPNGARNISAVAVKDAVPTTYVEGTDYDVDLVMGRIYILTTGSIVAATNLLVDYTTTASTRQRITTDSLGAKFGRLRFIADNTTGANRDLFGPHVELSPSGDIAWKSRDTIQQMEFDAEFLATALPALYIDGRPV